MNKILEIADLHYIGNGSDKVYHTCLREVDGGYVVEFAYGRRGSTLARGFKTEAPLPLERAKKVYESLVKAKTGKGYLPSRGVSGQVFAGDSEAAGNSIVQAAAALASEKVSTGVYPQLLNAVDEDQVEAFIMDPDWGAQEKKDGDRRMAKCSTSGIVMGINRESYPVLLPPELAASVADIGCRLLLDGEAIAVALHVFDLLEFAGQNLRGLPFIQRYMMLEEALKAHVGGALKLVPLAITEEEKRSLYRELRARDAEGIVFKRLDATYSEGRPASGGDQIKVKFYETLTALVLSISEGKRSVQLGLYPGGDSSKEPIFVGNVTIPSNKSVPTPGALAEIRYLYAYPNGGSLFQPTYLTERTDLRREACSDAQLKYVASEEKAA